MANLIKSKKYTGVYYRNRQDSDRTYFFTYKDTNHISKIVKVGLRSDGITEKYAFEQRSETISTLKNNKIPSIIREKKQYKILLDECANFYFTNHVTKTTEKRKRQYQNHIKPVFGNQNIFTISPSNIEMFKNKLSEKLSAQTVRMIIELIGTIYNYNIKYKNLKLANPIYSVSKPRIDNRRMRFLSKEEVRKLFEELDSDFILTLFTSLALSTAARKKTILNYSVKDVDLDNKMINSYDFKKDNYYQSFLDDRTVGLLKTRLAQCVSPNDKIIDIPEVKDIGRWISREMKIVLDNLFNVGLDASDSSQRIVIHSLRHTVLSHLGIKNANVFLIKQISNHSSTSMVERYVKLNSDSGRDEISNLWL